MALNGKERRYRNLSPLNVTDLPALPMLESRPVPSTCICISRKLGSRPQINGRSTPPISHVFPIRYCKVVRPERRSRLWPRPAKRIEGVASANDRFWKNAALQKLFKIITEDAKVLHLLNRCYTLPHTSPRLHVHSLPECIQKRTSEFLC